MKDGSSSVVSPTTLSVFEIAVAILGSIWILGSVANFCKNKQKDIERDWVKSLDKFGTTVLPSYQ